MALENIRGNYLRTINSVKIRVHKYQLALPSKQELEQYISREISQ
jgi:hypothetical protein